MNRETNPEPIGLASLIVPLYLPTLCIMFGYGMIVPVLPLFARFLGAGLGVTGVIVSMRGAGALLFDLPAGAIISRMRRLPILLFAAVAAALVAMATAFVDRLLPLGLLTIAMGAMQVLWRVSIQTHIRQNLPSHQRGRAMSLVGGTARVGWVLGPVTGGYVGKIHGLHSVYFGQAVVCLLAVLFLLIGSSHYRLRSREHRVELLQIPGIPFLRTVKGRARPVLLAGLVVIMLQMLRIGRQTLIPLWGEYIALDVAAIGLIFGLSRAIELVLVYPAGVLMDRLGRKWAAVPSLLLQSVTLALIPLTGGFSGLLLVSLLIGIGNGLGSGVVLTLGADLSPRALVAEFLGIWNLMGDIGATSGALLIGVVAQLLGLQVAPLLIAGLGIAGAWLMVFKVTETLSRKPKDT
jgi:MFS family permease